MKNFGLITFLLLLVCSCVSHQPGDFASQSGDLGAFIVESAANCGGHPSTNTVPVVETDWRCRPDAHGTAIRLIGDRLSDVQSILKPAFGQPDASLGSKPLSPCSPRGRSDEWYSHKQLGISIYIWGDKEETEVIILRGKP